MLYEAGLVSYRAGNMSVRTGEGLLITKSGAPLGFLRETLLISGSLHSPIPDASVELPVHQSIYRYAEANAIIHAHPPSAVVLSFFRETVVPADSEGETLLGSVPVIITEGISGSGDIALSVSELLRENVAVLVRGHGSFVKGDTLEEAFSRTSTLEASCRILCELMKVERKQGAGNGI